LRKFHLVLLLHSHQPVGNFDGVFEQAYEKCYRPFLDVLGRCPWVRVGLHHTGPLLEWIEAHRPEYFDALRELVERDQVELVGGGFYEPILVTIPAGDRLEQLRRMADYLEERFGRRPRGGWLAERVWEPHLPATFAAGGVEYSLVDDSHFLAAGFDREQLFGYFIAEELGTTLKLYPGLQQLRYLIPFHTVEENLEFLRAVAARHPGGCAVMGDDTEKFGVWPGTHDLCYKEGWLERFFRMLREQSDWLELATPGEYLDRTAPLGRADLPTSSYTEMMEWSLPTPARERFHDLQEEFKGFPEALPFLRGGFWRGFLTKYAESNLLHKKMLRVSGKVQALRQSARRGLPFGRALEGATTSLLRAQCNDAYWHGIFGGIYAPHLRTALWRELVRAEKIADAAGHGRPQYTELVRTDFDADGNEDLYWVSETAAVLLKPADGATVAALDFRPAETTLINSIQRRPEAYHARLAEAARGTAAPAPAGGQAVSIHEQVRVKEEGLEKFLHYDRWARHAFRLLLFAPWKGLDDYQAVRLEESIPFAAGRYGITAAGEERMHFTLEAPLAATAEGEPPAPILRADKSFTFERTEGGFTLGCELALRHDHSEALRLNVGLELVVNFLAPEADDRYIEAAGQRTPLRWSGSVAGSGLRLVDEWQGVAAAIEAPAAREFWIAPIETVSESEGGFERIYQGSQILAVWPMELEAGKTWKAAVRLHVTTAK
jgi:4-alpha-glucanotransferase